MGLKFLGFRRDPLKVAFDFENKKRWQPSEGRSFKLLAPDLEADRMFLAAEIKEVKQLDDNSKSERLYIAGIANANIVDRMQERLDPRGLDVTDYLKNAQLLAHHSYFHPVGQVEELDIQEDGIHFRGWIGDPAKGDLTPMQKEIRSLVSQRILKTVSVGFIPRKVRAPLFDDNGNMTEPCVIEAWELLELSIVAVPCNQDSVFEIRSYTNKKEFGKLSTEQTSKQSLNDSTKESLEQLAQDSMVVQTLILSKEKFSKEEAIAWVESHDFHAEKIDETEDSYRFRQREPEEFDQESFRTITLTEGVQAVVGKIKDGKAAEDNQGDNFQSEVLTMLRAMGELLKRNTEICDLMLKKMEEKPSEDEGGAKPEDEGEAAKTVENKPVEESETEKRLKSLEDQFTKIVKLVEVIAKKIS